MDNLLFGLGLLVLGIMIALAVVLGSFLGSYKAHEVYDRDKGNHNVKPPTAKPPANHP